MALRAYAGTLRVHTLAADVAVDAAELAQTFRGPGALARGDQLVRAALSASSNIAEACGRGTLAEFRQFLGYARGSARETLTQLTVARRLDKKRERQIRSLENRAALIVKMICRLMAHPPPETPKT
jgi:four helix bundle protein